MTTLRLPLVFLGALVLSAGACSNSATPSRDAGTTNPAGSSSGGSSGSSSSTSSGATSSGSSSSGAGSSGGSASGSSSGSAGDGGSPSDDGGPESGSSSDSGDAGLPKIPGTITIMAVGDSVTRATCWRAALWQSLNTSFPSRFHLVGTLNSDPGCGVTGYDTANQGYSSSLITEVVAGITTARTCDPLCPALSDFANAFNSVKPSVVLLHYGTNDVWNAKAPSAILNGYSALIDAARAANPNVVILLAQIIPMNVTSATCSGCSCPGCPTAVPALNAQIATWAPTKSTAASPVVVVDQYTGFDAVADTRDGVHPNNTTGSQKMAAKWFAALSPLF